MELDAEWKLISNPPLNSKDTILCGAGRFSQADSYLRAFYEDGKWYKAERGNTNLDLEELSNYKYWLDINKPIEFRKK